MSWTWTFVRFVHLVSAAVWVGGQATLVLVAAVARARVPQEERRALLAAVGRRFGAVGGIALLLLLVTGWELKGHIGVENGDLGHGTLGTLVLWKLLLWAAVTVLGVLHALPRWRERRALPLLTLTLSLVAVLVAARLATVA